MAQISRRDFLRNATVVASAATALHPSTLGADTAKRTNVELAIATICFDGFGDARHEPTFRLAPSVGIENLEINLWHPATLTPRYLDGIRERCADKGLKPVSLQGTSFAGGDRHAANLDIAHKLWLMRNARDLGCDVVKFTGRKRGTAGGLNHIIETCRELAPAAEDLGIALVLENHAGNVLENLEDYETIFSVIDSPNVGMCLDTGHFEGVGIALSDVTRPFRERILHVDLKDCAAFGAGHNTVVFGEGVTDFDTFLNDLIGGGYSGFLVVEMAWANPKEPLVANLTAARKLFAPYVKS